MESLVINTQNVSGRMRNFDWILMSTPLINIFEKVYWCECLILQTVNYGQRKRQTKCTFLAFQVYMRDIHKTFYKTSQMYLLINVCIKLAYFLRKCKTFYLCTNNMHWSPDLIISYFACSCSSSSEGMSLIFNTASPFFKPHRSATPPGFTCKIIFSKIRRLVDGNDKNLIMWKRTSEFSVYCPGLNKSKVLLQ